MMLLLNLLIYFIIFHINQSYQYQLNKNVITKIYNNKIVNEITIQNDKKDKIINKYIINTINHNKLSNNDIKQIKIYLNNNKQSINYINIVTLLYNCSKYKYNVVNFLDIQSINQILRSIRLDNRGMANVLYGLSSITEINEDSLQLIEYLTNQLNTYDYIFDIKAISNSFNGLKHLTAVDKRIEFFIASMNKLLSNNLNQLIKKSNDIKSSDITILVNSLQNLPVDNINILTIYSSIYELLNHCEMLDSQAIANLIFSLRLKTNHDIIDKIINRICDNVIRYNYISIYNMSIREFTMCICGFQSMSSSTFTTQRLLNIFNTVFHQIILLNNKSSKLSQLYITKGIELGSLFNGFKGLSNQHIEVVDFMSNINTILSSSITNQYEYKKQLNITTTPLVELTDIQIGGCIHSLQSFTSNHIEILKLLSNLYKFIQYNTLLTSSKSIANALYGLQGMSAGYIEVQGILRYLLNSLNNLNNSTISSQIVKWKGSEIASMCYGLQSMSHTQSSIVVPIIYSISNQVDNYFDDKLSHSDYALAIYGMKNMPSNHSSVIRLITSLTNKWVDNSKDITSQEITMIIQGIRNINNYNHNIIEYILLKLTFIIKKSRPKLVFTNHQLTTIMNSLQSLGTGSPNQNNLSIDKYVLSKFGYGIMTLPKKRLKLSNCVNSFLELLVDLLDQRMDRFSGPMVATCLYGLQGMSAESSVIQRILIILNDDLIVSNDHLTSQNIGNALYGMQNMTSKYLEVENLLITLAQAIDLSPQHVNAQAVGNSFYGLQHMSFESEAVRLVVTSLTKKINHMPVPTHFDYNNEYFMSGQNIGNSLWGFRNVTIAYPEVLSAISAINNKIIQTKHIMNGQNIANAIYSLQSLSDSYIEIKNILASIAFKIVVSDAQLSGLDVAMILYGLKSKDSTSPEVRVILGSIIHKIKSSSLQFQLNELTLAIIGILKMSPWIKDDIIKVLAMKTPGMKYLSNDN